MIFGIVFSLLASVDGFDIQEVQKRADQVCNTAVDMKNKRALFNSQRQVKLTKESKPYMLVTFGCLKIKDVNDK